MTIKFNERKMRQVFEGPRGDVARLLAKRGVQIESTAKALATQYGLVRSGRYRASIAWRIENDGGLALIVGSNVEHARYLEEGTPPHVILPRRPKYALWWKDIAPSSAAVQTSPNVFFDQFGERAGRHPVSKVNHPGNRAYRVLTNATRRVLIRRYT